MIAIQKIGKSFMGALRYNEKKTLHPDKSKRAVLLDSNFTATDLWGIKREVEIVRSLRPSLNRYVYHTSLNFHQADKLDDNMLLEIAHDYLRTNGFDDNQYLIYRHHDADHPHLHLLVNRIRFDGSVVSDSNNYKKSEAILRKLEEHYNLKTVESAHQITVERHNKVTDNRGDAVTIIRNNQGTKNLLNDGTADRSNGRAEYIENDISEHGYNKGIRKPDNGITGEQSNRTSLYQKSDVTNAPYTKSAIYQDNLVPAKHNKKASKRAPTKNELEMIGRTGQVSEKLLLQEKLTLLVPLHGITIKDFILACERQGIRLLFNQASTGRVSGITYFHNGFKIRGQALGNRFKWGELIKHIDYEQGRDSETIRAANDKTRANYDQRQSPAATGRNGQVAPGIPAGPQDAFRKDGHQPTSIAGDHTTTGESAEGFKSQPDVPESIGVLHRADSAPEYDRLDPVLNVQISDDVDDEAVSGMKRRRQEKPRMNRR